MPHTKTTRTWYERYLASDHWKALRAAKAKAANYQCERCGEFGKRTAYGTIAGLQVHHLTYERLWNEELSDLLVLCIPCHQEEHGLAVADEKHREHVRRRLSRRIAGSVTPMYVPDDYDIDLEIAAWDDLARRADW